MIHQLIEIIFLAASLRERDERAARKAAKKLQKARQTETANSQVVDSDAATVQPQVAIPNGMMQTRNSQFYSPLPPSTSPLFPSADFTNTMQATPVTPVFQGANLTLPPRSLGGWNQNQYVNPESSLQSNDLEPWNQLGHQGNPNFTGTSIFYKMIFFTKNYTSQVRVRRLIASLKTFTPRIFKPN